MAQENIKPQPQRSMPPEAQRLTFEMARGLQQADQKRYLDEGWTLSQKHDDAAKETPYVKTFDRLDSDQKKPYFDTAANAVMVLLDEGYKLSPSPSPEIPLPSDVRRSAEEALVAAGRSKGDARSAVAAIEAAGFMIEIPMSPELKKMDAFYDMSLPEMGGDEDAALTATLNMARKEGFSMKDINVFLKEKNEERQADGLRPLPLLTKEGEAQRLAGVIAKEYDKAYEKHRDEMVARAGAAVSVDGRLLDRAQDALATKRAVETARQEILYKLDAVKDAEMRGLAVAAVSKTETAFMERVEQEAAPIEKPWMKTLSLAKQKDEQIRDLHEKHETAMKRWRRLRWYEKIFVPRPLAPDKKVLSELQEEKADLLEQCRQEFNRENDDVRTVVFPDGGFSKIGMQIRDGNPVLAMSTQRDGLVSTTQRIMLADGTFEELSSTSERESVPDSVREVARPSTEAAMLRLYESLTQELSREMERQDEDRREDVRQEKIQTVSLEEAYAAHREFLERRETEKEAVRTEETRERHQETQRRKREDAEWMPSLHPNLAGDISQKDVDILMAFRFNGGRKEDVQHMINTLKEKKEIVYTGFVTYRPTEAYDGERLIPVRKVSIGLRVGANGNIQAFSPSTGKILGPVDKALSSPSLSSVRKKEKPEEKQKKQKKDEKPKMHFNQ